MVASLYVSSIQGRIGGINKLSKQNGIELEATGTTLAKEFKTDKTFTFQAVTLPQDFRRYLSMYLRFARLWALLQATDPKSAFYIARDGTLVEALFVSARGGIIDNLGLYVTKFFSRTIGGGLHIKTNMIRTIMETGIKSAYDHGLVSQAEMTAAHNVNGHSGLTAQRHYQLVNSLHDAETSRRMMDRLMPDAISPLVESTPHQHAQSDASVPVLLDQLEQHLKADSTESATLLVHQQYQQDVHANLAACSSYPAQYRQDAHANLSACSSYPAQYRQDAHANLSAYSSYPAQYQQAQYQQAQYQDDSRHALTTSSHNLVTNSSLSLLSWSSGPGWGHLRKDIGISKLRYEWIAEEKQIIGNFCMAELNKYTGTSKYAEAQRNIVSSCLEYIRGNGKDVAYPWFHPTHIEKSDRLKSGYESARKMDQFKSLPQK